MTPTEIARSLTGAQRKALLKGAPNKSRRGNPIHHRAGDLFPGSGPEYAQGWLRETKIFERYFYGGHFAYRLTPLGLAVRAALEKMNDDPAV